MAAWTPARAQGSAASGPVSVAASEQLFSTMCALYAAGFPAESNVLNTDPAFVNLLAQLRQQQGPATEALRQYYRDHILVDPAATMSRYITFALVAGPAPTFAIPLRREDFPPDVASLDGFSEVLAKFYQEAQIEQRWREMQPLYDRLGMALREPLGRIVLTETGYLRELLRPGAHSFTVYAEPLVGSRTNFRNMGGRYAVAAHPGLDASQEISHAFLHFLLDPLPLKYSAQVLGASRIMKVAGSAPRLPVELRNDWMGYFTECLVRSVELRLRRLPPAQLAAEVNSAEADGYVLVRPLVEGLAKFEASEPAMSYYFPDLVRSFDPVQLEQRLQTVKFAAASNQQGQTSGDPANGVAVASAAASSDVESALAEGEQYIVAHEAPAAAAAFGRVLEKVPGQPRALYGLAVAMVLQGNKARAVALFDQIVAASSGTAEGSLRPDANVLAWSHVYLGRMRDLEGNREKALLEYRAALSVGGAPEAARAAAQRGIEQEYQPAVPAPG
jgi:hypothetical protein